jgi:hypothetical protein
MLSESQVNTIMKDIFLIKRARKLMQQSRPLPIDTVMQLNILERHLRVPSKEFDEFFIIAIKDMNSANSW